MSFLWEDVQLWATFRYLGRKQIGGFSKTPPISSASVLTCIDVSCVNWVNLFLTRIIIATRLEI